MRVGVIGLGLMGTVHLAAWQAAGATITAVLDNKIDHAATLAAQYNCAVCTREEMLERVDVVDICVPTPQHLELTIAAATAGKHVVCEKPIALTIKDAQAMLDSCQAANVRLFIAHVVRFFPQYQTAAASIARGEIGSLGTMRFKRAGQLPAQLTDNWFLDEKRSGGVVLDLMIHDFDTALWYAQNAKAGTVTRVFARSTRAINADIKSDVVIVTLRFESGVIAHLEGAWAYPAGIFRTGFDIAGSAGVLEWRSDDNPAVMSFLATASEASAGVGMPDLSAGADPYHSQIAHVKNALETDTPFAVTANDAMKALKLALAARESLQTGLVVNL